MPRQVHESALVLHVRAYRESSAIVQFFTRDQGRIAGVVRGARRKHGVALQPFAVGLLTVVGRSNLVTVSSFEQTRAFALHGDALIAGFYVLELMTRLLDERQAEPSIFAAVQSVLGALAAGDDVQRTLRPFELGLLAELGYGIDFGHDRQTAAPIDAAGHYSFAADAGFTESGQSVAGYPGWALSAIARGDFADDSVVRYARTIVRSALAPLLGARPLVSRRMVVPRNSDG